MLGNISQEGPASQRSEASHKDGGPFNASRVALEVYVMIGKFSLPSSTVQVRLMEFNISSFIN